MACDFCREVECHVDERADVTVYVTLGDLLAVDVGGSCVTLVPIRYCPMCGQDMREAIHAD